MDSLQSAGQFSLQPPGCVNTHSPLHLTPRMSEQFLEAAWQVGWLLHTVNEGLATYGLFHKVGDKGWPRRHLQ